MNLKLPLMPMLVNELMALCVAVFCFTQRGRIGNHSSINNSSDVDVSIDFIAALLVVLTHR